ncbi:hypothetical protein HF1_10520 [Mycoplasma haemofelis str. Langford 1]|uniref:Uncharacterized protein n=1 Tax=Mycoplasma haemofelis (strain Langford 1) TaxID=941640 RepID=E8ZIT9_MYCHL|nr:hypothetical protein [Mycoplasma haemofelis]CBY93060.1 hypothetical protein HF1_10520 [Mycoplasma haemofelis str. Langford 1]
MPSLSLLKVICGGVAATAGTLGIGSFLLPEAPAEESIATKKASFEEQEDLEEIEETEQEEVLGVEDQAEESLSTEDEETVEEVKKEPEPVVPKCTFYVVKNPERTRNGKIVKEIIKKVTENQEAFLKGKSDAFNRDIKKACPSTLTASKDIYVWEEYAGWMYADDVSNKNWLAQEGVTVPPELKVDSKGN